MDSGQLQGVLVIDSGLRAASGGVLSARKSGPAVCKTQSMPFCDGLGQSGTEGRIHTRCELYLKQ